MAHEEPAETQMRLTYPPSPTLLFLLSLVLGLTAFALPWTRVVGHQLPTDARFVDIFPSMGMTHPGPTETTLVLLANPNSLLESCPSPPWAIEWSSSATLSAFTASQRLGWAAILLQMSTWVAFVIVGRPSSGFLAAVAALLVGGVVILLTFAGPAIACDPPPSVFVEAAALHWPSAVSSLGSLAVGVSAILISIKRHKPAA
jgi:hypothetical protein